MVAPNATRLRHRLTDLAGSGLDTATFGRVVCEALATAVDYDFACLATTDPATGLITGTVKSHPGDSMDELFARYEYEITDLNQFVELARRAIPVGVLDLDTDGHPAHSPRYRDFLRPMLSFGHELRAVFRAADATWGVIGLYRSTGPHGFTTTDVDVVAAVTDIVANGIRTSLITAPASAGHRCDPGPAVLVLGPDDRTRLLTTAAEHRVDELGGTTHGALPMSLLSLAAATRAARSHGAPAPAATRIRTSTGWLTARAAPVAASREVVITLDLAQPPEIMPLLAAGYRLTHREQEITRMVLLGADTTAIAARLYLSPYTVQDHLKSIFAKVGVSNRRQLTATIFFHEYGPHIGEPLGADGWFTG